MLTPWKESYDQPRQHIKKQRHDLQTTVCLVKDMVFPVVMYGCKSWTIKKAEHRRIGTFELWCWRRLLRVPWTARRSNKTILKETSPEYSLEGLILKLKLQYFGHLMWRTDSFWKDPDAGKDWGQERGMTEDEMVEWHHQHDGHGLWWTLAVGDGQGGLACCGPCSRSVGHNWMTKLTDNLLYGPTLTSTHDSWKNSFDYMDFCWQSLLICYLVFS